MAAPPPAGPAKVAEVAWPAEAPNQEILFRLFCAKVVLFGLVGAPLKVLNRPSLGMFLRLEIGPLGTFGRSFEGPGSTILRYVSASGNVSFLFQIDRFYTGSFAQQWFFLDLLELL